MSRNGIPQPISSTQSQRPITSPVADMVWPRSTSQVLADAARTVQSIVESVDRCF